MKNGVKPLFCLLSCSVLLGTAVQAKAQVPTAQTSAKPDTKKLSYAIGYQIGSQFADGKPQVSIPALLQGIQDAYAKRHPTVSAPEMHRQMQLLKQQMHTEALAEFEQIAAANARKSAAYMAENRRKPGVVQLPSGIQYSVMAKGDGKVSPTVTSTVVVNYLGMLIDGTEFDSTWAHGAPVSFAVNGVIPGWRDVIPRMHVGDRWRVVIPSKLAYGQTGALPRIGPNEALIFEIELLDIKSGSSGR